MRDFDIETLEQMAARFNPLPINDVYLDARYDWQKNENAVEWPYYRFFYHLAKWLQPKLVVELGGWQGTAAAHFAVGCRESTIVTIDHHSDEGDQHHQELMQQVFYRYSNLYYECGWSTSEVAEREKGNHALGNREGVNLSKYFSSIDILFIDSWHTYDNAMIDWRVYQPLLSNNALVICDDIQGGEGEFDPISGMLRFWNEMPDPKFLNSNLHPATNLGFIKYEVK